MKCLFVHDFRGYKREGRVYSTNFSYEILKKRYVDTFGELYILNRSGEMPDNQSEKGYVEASGDGVIFLDAIPIFTPISFAKEYPKIKKTVIEQVAKSEYTIIRLDSFLGLIAAEYCRTHNKKYLIEVVGCVWDSFWNKGATGKLVAYPLYKKMQYEIKHAPYAVYVTSQFLQGRYPTGGRNTNISNVHLGQQKQEELDKRLEKIAGFDETGVVNLVTVASVQVRYKGQDTVIRALSELKKRGIINYRYHLIGGGDDSYLRGLAEKCGVSDQVVFHGSMNHGKVMDFLDDCDVYIQPSKQEGLPRALIEAMSKGLLCFGTKVAGIPELLDPNMIFSTKSNAYLEIANLLVSVNKEMMENEAKRNFEEAKKYEGHILEKRRKDFFSAFIAQE